MYPLHHLEARRWLIENWARVPKRRLLLSKGFWLGLAPVDEIRDYFGEEEAFYFAWLGLYTRMLYIPAAVGLLVQVLSAVGCYVLRVGFRVLHQG